MKQEVHAKHISKQGQVGKAAKNKLHDCFMGLK
jgi:hypothetical protein